MYRGENADAIKYLTDAYNSNPNDPTVLYNLSLAYSKKKDFTMALEIINKCLMSESELLRSKYFKASNSTCIKMKSSSIVSDC